MSTPKEARLTEMAGFFRRLFQSTSDHRLSSPPKPVLSPVATSLVSWASRVCKSYKSLAYFLATTFDADFLVQIFD